MYVGYSFEDVFEQEYEPLHGYLARRLGNSTADELAAETFAVAYRRWGDLDPSRPVRPWLYGIATNLLRHHWRRERRMLRAYVRKGVETGFDYEEDASVERADVKGLRRALAAALAELRPPEREVLLLTAWTDLSDAEVAAALSVPVGTVKSRLHRAREHMRNHLTVTGQLEVGAQTATRGE